MDKKIPAWTSFIWHRGSRDGKTNCTDKYKEKEMKPTIIHTRVFSCANDHPVVWYTFDENNKAMCEYCATHFVYEQKEDYDE